MQNTYTLEVRAACPVHDGEKDLYHVTVTSQALIEVELIIAFFDRFKTQKIFQEELTCKAATALGARVETIGIHSGVTVHCVAP